MSDAEIDPAAFLPPGVAMAVPEAPEAAAQADQERPAGRQPVDVAALSRIESEFTAVEAALAALDSGTYGVCDVCGEPIDPALLAADPVRRGCASHPLPAGA